jgi:hypothetical protein
VFFKECEKTGGIGGANGGARTRAESISLAIVGNDGV